MAAGTLHKPVPVGGDPRSSPLDLLSIYLSIYMYMYIYICIYIYILKLLKLFPEYRKVLRFSLKINMTRDIATAER